VSSDDILIGVNREGAKLSQEVSPDDGGMLSLYQVDPTADGPSCGRSVHRFIRSIVVIVRAGIGDTHSPCHTAGCNKLK